MSVSLNIDLGELPDEPDELYGLATVVNVACGGHAGDQASMRHAVDLSRRHGVRVAAHPSYADREGFGRRPLHQPARAAADAVGAQCAALAATAHEAQLSIEILKLHGALYHDAARDRALAELVLDAARDALPALGVIVGPPGSALDASARARGLAFDAEAFADRRYLPSGALAPRSDADALVLDVVRCVEQALSLARSGRYGTVCLHADTPGALDRARAVRSALSEARLLAARG